MKNNDEIDSDNNYELTQRTRNVVPFTLSLGGGSWTFTRRVCGNRVSNCLSYYCHEFGDEEESQLPIKLLTL